MFRSKRVRAVACSGAVLGLVVGGVWTGVAVAAPPGATKAIAPYAQAAAVVNSDGSVNRSKGIAGVTKPAVGRYCVELEDKEVDVTRLVPVATLQYTSFEYGIRISMWPDPTCGNRTDTFLVITGKTNVWEDRAFSIVIP
ncbi:hypothetical protein [Kitasatospora sp. MAP5-34]|uniref:hypothetical protein n=1 Tax=Kitasatospora sp. MAP5-34 TaxID=3035102 RepID=UPI00247380C5|nr:hypothetical protein [Kitasatospora sp. MAP5-34]MDH6580261.1 hypothetical protein [Kitasatospora sp. MAP5-34]